MNLLSRIKPKYLNELDERIGVLFRVMFGHMPGLSVNVVCIELFDLPFFIPLRLKIKMYL